MPEDAGRSGHAEDLCSGSLASAVRMESAGLGVLKQGRGKRRRHVTRDKCQTQETAGVTPTSCLDWTGASLLAVSTHPRREACLASFEADLVVRHHVLSNSCTISTSRTGELGTDHGGSETSNARQSLEFRSSSARFFSLALARSPTPFVRTRPPRLAQGPCMHERRDASAAGLTHSQGGRGRCHLKHESRHGASGNDQRSSREASETRAMTGEAATMMAWPCFGPSRAGSCSSPDAFRSGLQTRPTWLPRCGSEMHKVCPALCPTLMWLDPGVLRQSRLSIYPEYVVDGQISTENRQKRITSS